MGAAGSTVAAASAVGMGDEVLAPPGASPRVVIVGAGLAGLCAAWTLRHLRPDVDVRVFEAAERPGGCVRATQVGDMLVEEGPMAFLPSIPDTLELAVELGLHEELITAAPAARKRWLYRAGRLHELPSNPVGLMRSPLISRRGALRILGEAVQPRGGYEEESLHDFASRRFGEECAEKLVAPMLLGITGGDARRTSVRALFPFLAELEAEHGSVLRGFVGRKRAPLPPALEGFPRNRLTTFREGGLQRLVAVLAEALGPALSTGCAVTRVERREAGGWKVEAGGSLHYADALVVATSAPAAARLLGETSQPLASALQGIRHAGMDVWALGWPRDQMPHTLDGFGFLVPRAQGLRILGCTFNSTIFPDQTPSERVLLRVMVGGDVDPGALQLDDGESLDVVMADLGAAIGVRAMPTFQRRIRWPGVLPQYAPDHLRWMRDIELAVADQGSLVVAGHSYRGVGVNHAVREGREAAHRALAMLGPLG